MIDGEEQLDFFQSFILFDHAIDDLSFLPKGLLYKVGWMEVGVIVAPLCGSDVYRS